MQNGLYMYYNTNVHLDIELYTFVFLCHSMWKYCVHHAYHTQSSTQLHNLKWEAASNPPPCAVRINRSHD